MNQEILAMHVGVKQGQISKIISGKSGIRGYHLVKLMVALDITMEELYYDKYGQEEENQD